jgi:serine/threonine protein kinase
MTLHHDQVRLTRDEFFRNLKDSSLLSPGDVLKQSELLSDIDDGAAAIRFLVDTNVLTQYQAEAIADRRFEQLVLGNYEILAKLGAGGMGAVFKARHRRMKRIVAVKVLSSDIARQSSFVKRFQREVETIAQLTHPNIVMAFDADEADIGHFLVMEYVEGRDLASEVHDHGPLSVEAAVDVITQAASGMAYAHTKGIIHRDIKPANLMLTNLGVVKVADLGLARITGMGDERDTANFSLTQAGGILGTVDYMPPEQSLDSTAIDHRADIYSLGCTLYFLLTGKPPYAAGSLMGLMLQHRDAPIPSLASVRHDVPPALVTVFERMIAKQPADRPQSMDDVIRLLDALKPQVKHLTLRPGTTSGKPSEASTNDMTLDVGNASSLISSRTAAYGPSESQSLSDAVIVLVEPSRTQNAIVRGYLTKLGISQIHATGSGTQALAWAKEKQAHALISTMHLSEMTGVQLVQGLRSDPSTADVGFVLMTSESDTSLTQDLLNDPLTIVLIKPFDLNRLAQSITATTNRTA